MKRLFLLVLLTGCAATQPALDPEKVIEGFQTNQKNLTMIVQSLNKFITCTVEAKKFDEVKPCLMKTPMPTPTPGASK